MKKCPFCAEIIQDDAVKCRFCGEFLEKPDKGQGEAKLPFYFRFSFIVGLFCCVGPLALPVIWLHPRYSMKAKVITTVLTAIFSYFVGVLVIHSVQNILKYYQQLGGL